MWLLTRASARCMSATERRCSASCRTCAPPPTMAHRRNRCIYMDILSLLLLLCVSCRTCHVRRLQPRLAGVPHSVVGCWVANPNATLCAALGRGALGATAHPKFPNPNTTPGVALDRGALGPSRGGQAPRRTHGAAHSAAPNPNPKPRNLPDMQRSSMTTRLNVQF